MSDVPSCDGCGLCCMEMNLMPHSGYIIDFKMGGPTPSWEPMPDELLQELKVIGFSPRHGDNTCPCVWLDRVTGRCKHHEYRPLTCREFEIGCDHCLSLRQEAGLNCWGKRT